MAATRIDRNSPLRAGDVVVITGYKCVISVTFERYENGMCIGTRASTGDVVRFFRNDVLLASRPTNGR